jgi:VWFA-related protein
MQRNRLITVLCIAAGIAAALSHRTAAQDQQPPAFRSAIDLVPVDVSVVDNNGRPVSGLEAGDFVLTVDGKPRRIASAEFVSASQELTATPAPTPTHYSTNTGSGAGRLIMIVVDQGNIGNGRGRQLMESASKFVMRLGPSDRVGLVAIPGSGPQVDFTANHAVVAAMLQRLERGRRPRVQQ